MPVYMSTGPIPTDPAVYMVRSRRTGAAYIGSTCELAKRRAGHLQGITRGNHYNKYIRAAFAGHVPDEVEFVVLEAVQVPKRMPPWKARMFLHDREHHWVRTLNPVLNICYRSCSRKEARDAANAILNQHAEVQ